MDFEIRAAYNGSTGNSISNIKIELSSQYLDINEVNANDFSSAAINGQKALFTLPLLEAGKQKIGNISTMVKSSVGPLSSLIVKFTANASMGGDDIKIEDGVSKPTVYAVFPEINTTKSINAGMPFSYNFLRIPQSISMF